MVKTFGLRTPEWVHFGNGTVQKVGLEAKRLGAGRVMVLTDPGVKAAGLLDKVTAPLKTAGLDFDVFDGVEPEPSIQSLLEASKMAKDGKFEVFVAVGGGGLVAG